MHHNYVCALLNDLFGIQSKTFSALGDSYAQSLFGLDQKKTNRFCDAAKLGERKSFKVILPGYVRVDLSWTFSDDEVKTKNHRLAVRESAIRRPKRAHLCK